MILEDLSRQRRNTIRLYQLLKKIDQNEINVVVRGMGNVQSIVNGKKNSINPVMSSL